MLSSDPDDDDGRRSIGFTSLIAPAACLAIAAVANETDTPAPTFDGVVVETVATHRFAAGDGEDLRPDDRGAIRLWIPREHPAAANARLQWLTPGLEGPHPFLDGHYRFGVYRDLVLEWLAATSSVEGETVGEVAHRLTDGLSPEMTFDAAAERIRARARTLPDREREELDDALGDLAPWGDGVPVAQAAANGTLEMLVASALAHGRVRGRMAAAEALVRERVAGVDPVFDDAFREALHALNRRRALMRLVIKQKIKYHRNDPDDEGIRNTRVALVPISLVRSRYPAWSEEDRHHLGMDYALDAGGSRTLDAFYRFDSALIGLATLDRRLFGGDHLDPTCPSVGRAREQWLLRAYLADYACMLVDRLHETFDVGFFADSLGWETTPEAYADFLSTVDTRRLGVEAAMRACVELSDDAFTAAAGVEAPRLDTLVRWMTGSFSSAEQASMDSTYFDVRLETVPIWPERTDGRWLYVEQAVSAHLDRPYRQRIYRVHATDDGIESTVYALPAPEAFVGAWREPERLSVLEPDSLEERTGCAVHLVWSGDHFEGGTAGDACESSLAGASYATSEVRIYADRMETWDRGYAADGAQVWGATTGGYVFRKLRRPDDP